MFMLFFFFFFSSRRRHTRYIGDWSSDVCSSDLRGWHPGWMDGVGIVAIASALVSVYLLLDRFFFTPINTALGQIGRASCRERVEMSEGAVAVKKKNIERCEMIHHKDSRYIRRSR